MAPNGWLMTNKMVFKPEIVQLLMKKTGFTRLDCEEFLEGYYDVLIEQLANKRAIRLGPIGTIKPISHLNPHYDINERQMVQRDRPRWRLKFTTPEPFRRFLNR